MTEITTVGVDADDTLWHNETIFRLTHARFVDLLDDHGDAATIEARLAAHPSVREAACTVEGEGSRRRLVAHVVPAGDAPVEGVQHGRRTDHAQRGAQLAVEGELHRRQAGGEREDRAEPGKFHHLTRS